MIIDLFSGLGRWKTSIPVIKLDIDPKTKPDILCDVKNIPLRKKLKPILIHASPPCTYFSNARARKHGWHTKGIAESLELVASCFHAFDYLEPLNWTLENPVGKLGQILNQIRLNYNDSYEFDKKPTHFWSNMKSLKRSIIPQDIRQKILNEIT